jgi:signal transduction histidine kinase
MISEPVALHDFIVIHQDEIIRRCRSKVTARHAPRPTQAEIEHGVPIFLGQLVDALQLGLSSTTAIDDTALLHGRDLLAKGFSVSQVVHDYGDVCQSITELAAEAGAPIDAGDFRRLNSCLDAAIAAAVTEYGRERHEADTKGQAILDNEGLGFFVHELRNLLNTAVIAFEVVKSGNVGVGGSTGDVLHRALSGARDLITRSMAGVRLGAGGSQLPERFLLREFIQELVPGALLAATMHRVTLLVEPVNDEIAIEADRQILAAAVTNLLQNAFKFTAPQTTVTLRVTASDDRVLIDVEDACGGLHGDTTQLFQSFEQRSKDRSGMGLGLSFSRQAVETNNGRLYARSLPGVGCIFTIDLPRVGISPLVLA